MSFTSDGFDCPCCGAEVVAGASFCRECGASDDAGWNADEEEGFGTDDDFDYDEYIEREFSVVGPLSREAKLKRIFTVIVLVCISLTLLSVLGM